MNENTGKEGINLNEVPPWKKGLFLNVLKDMSGSTLNSENLGKYRNSELATVEVMKRLKNFGLLDILREFKEKILHVPFLNKEDEAVDSERLARILLMNFERNQSFTQEKKE